MKSNPFDLDTRPPFDGFPPEGIRFLKRLKANNDREWFAAHKGEYLEFVRTPMESLLAALAGPIGRIAPEMHVDPKKCIFRIYRDTRFSRDKRPYKTHVAAIIHPRGHWEESAGLYLHIEPGEVYLGGGIYMPDGPQLKKIRAAVASKPGEFLAIVEGTRFRKRFGTLRGDRLSRAPLGYPPDHPMIEWLKWKQMFVAVEWEEGAAGRKDFVERVTGVYGEMMPLVRFINAALHAGGGRRK